MSARPQGPTGLEADRPDAPAEAIRELLSVLRRRIWLALAVALACVGASFAFLSVRTVSYESGAQLLVTPLPPVDETFVGIPVLRAVGPDAARPTLTMANLIDTAAIDRAAARASGVTEAEVEAAIDIEVVEGSDVIAVTATASSPEVAADIANAYVEAVIDVRGELVDDALEARVEALSSRLEDEAFADPTEQAELESRVATLRSAIDGGDPTLSIAREATVPTAPIEDPPWMVLAAAVILGCVLGAATALLRERIGSDRTLGQAAALEGLSVEVMGRVRPRDDRSGVRSAGIQALRRRVEIARQHRAGPRTIVVAASGVGTVLGSAGSELAIALARAGSEVVVIPTVAGGHGSGTDAPDLLDVVMGEPIESALRADASQPGLLRLAPPSEADASHLDGLGEQLGEVIAAAERVADWVVIETESLLDGIGALLFAPFADQLLLALDPAELTEEASAVLGDRVSVARGSTEVGLILP
ncbi:hypothetical protein HJD18_07025 [Thermoleophilia bacterium SCSIO 60948]|nr:hypothetical protein HJD18_07025 [Thermoleophilia bacterium SCSIO 60948]